MTFGDETARSKVWDTYDIILYFCVHADIFDHRFHNNMTDNQGRYIKQWIGSKSGANSEYTFILFLSNIIYILDGDPNFIVFVLQLYVTESDLTLPNSGSFLNLSNENIPASWSHTDASPSIFTLWVWKAPIIFDFPKNR